MEVKILNTIGLVLSILGGVIWFFYGIPEPSQEAGDGIALEDATRLSDGRTAAQPREEALVTKARYRCLSKLALVLIIAGFLLQLLATWWPNTSLEPTLITLS